MNSKYIFAAVAVIVVVGIGLFMYSQGRDNTEVANQNNTADNSQDTIDDIDTNTDSNANANADTTNTNSVNANTAPIESGVPPTGEPTVPENLDIAVFEIVYNGSSFSPSTLTIKNGDVVIFKNESDESFWPASGPHPVHTNYPEFDPKKAIPAGQDWQFKFTKSGEWPFHNHLNPSVTGKIIVQ